MPPVRVPPLLVPLAVAGLCVVSAQRGAGQDQRQVFRASTTYVSLDVVVTDNDDRPVTDLRKDEFRISERGRPQAITDFSFVSLPSSHRAIDLDAAAPPPADVAVNAMSYESSRALAIVVDDGIDLSRNPGAIVYYQRVLRRVLEGLGPGDQAALTFVRRSDLARDFTSDRDQLIAAVKSLRDAFGMTPLGRFNKPDLFSSLEHVIDALAGARQARKAIVLVNTRGCDPSNPDFGDMCRDLIERARRAGVPIYGLNPMGLTDALSSAGAGGFDSPEGRAGIEAAIQGENDSLKILARETGGLAFVRSDLDSAVREVFADNSSFYLVGYYPNPVPNDGKFHDVEVAVTRPGVRVRSRAGYRADGGRARPMTATREMTGHLGAGLPDPSLPLRASVISLAAGRRGTMSLVTAELTYPAPDGGFSGAFKDEWRLGVLALTSDAKITSSFQRPVTFNGIWKPTAHGTFVVSEILDLPRNTSTVRIGVTSRTLGKTGTVHVPVTLPDFTKKELQLSALAIGIAGDRLASADAAIGLDHVSKFVPFQPTMEREFTAAHTLRIFARASWRSSDEQPTGKVQIVRGPGSDARVVSEAPAVWRDTGIAPRGGQRHGAIDEKLSLAALTAGSYVLRVTATLTRGEPAVRAVPFEIR